MSKKNKKGVVLLASLLTFGAISASALVSCGETPTTPAPVDPLVNSITITNKADLQKEWRVRDADREITLTADPADFNIAAALDSGDLMIESSDTTIVNVLGKKLKALKEGTVTITASVGEVKDTVEITVLPWIEMTTTTVAEGLAAAKGSVVAVKGKVIQVANKGFFVADDTGIIYVYKALDATLKLGDTVNVKGKLDEYGGLQQIKSGTDYAIEKAGAEIAYTATFTEMDGKALDALLVDPDKTGPETAPIAKAQLVKVAATIIRATANDSYLKEDRYLFDIVGLKDTSIFYTGYLNPEHIGIIGSKDATGADVLGKRFIMEGVIGGKGSHGEFTDRFNFYPTTITPTDPLPVTVVNAKASFTTLLKGQPTQITYSVDDGAYGVGELVVKSGAEFIEIDPANPFVIKGLAAAADGSAAKAEVAVKVGNLESAPITLTIENKDFVPTTIAEAEKVPAGGLVYVKAKYMSTFGSGKNLQGAYFGDGDNAIYVRGFDNKLALKANDTVTILGFADIYNGGFQVKAGAEVEKSTEVVADPTAKTFASIAELTGANTGDLYTLTGTLVAAIAPNKYGNAHFDLTLDNGEVVNVRADSRYEVKATCEALLAAAAGSKITLKAHLTHFVKGTTTLPADNAGLQFQHISDLVIEAPAAPVDQAPAPTPAA